MISQVDACVLVLDVQEVIGQNDLSLTGRAKDFVMISKTLRVPQMIVCINKLDMKNRDEEKFYDGKVKVTEMLTALGYESDKTKIIPVSGLDSLNIAKNLDTYDWYQGETLMESMENLRPPKRRIEEMPLRIPILKRLNEKKILIGIVQYGKVSDSQLLKDSRNYNLNYLKGMESDFKKIMEARAGDYVGFELDGTNYVQAGNLIGSLDDPPSECSSFVAMVNFVPSATKKIEIGYKPCIHCYTASVSCKLAEIQSKFDSSTGELIENDPKKIEHGKSFKLVFQPENPLAVEKFADYPRLGSIILTDNQYIIGYGIITDVTK